MSYGHAQAQRGRGKPGHERSHPRRSSSHFWHGSIPKALSPLPLSLSVGRSRQLTVGRRRSSGACGTACRACARDGRKPPASGTGSCRTEIASHPVRRARSTANTVRHVRQHSRDTLREIEAEIEVQVRRWINASEGHREAPLRNPYTETQSWEASSSSFRPGPRRMQQTPPTTRPLSARVSRSPNKYAVEGTHTHTHRHRHRHTHNKTKQNKTTLDNGIEQNKA